MTPDPVSILSPASSVAVPEELYKPAGTAATGLVVIAYGTDGRKGPWTAMMRGYAEDLAGRGLFVLMPDCFARTGTAHGGAAALQIGQKQDDWPAALVDTVAFARTLPSVDASCIGMLGFSLGGYLCLRARAAARPKALVQYFAPMFEGIGPRAACRWPRFTTAPATSRRPASRMRPRLQHCSSSNIQTSRCSNTKTPRTALRELLHHSVCVNDVTVGSHSTRTSSLVFV